MQIPKAEMIAKLMKEYVEVKGDIESSLSVMSSYRDSLERYADKNKKQYERLAKLEVMISKIEG